MKAAAHTSGDKNQTGGIVLLTNVPAPYRITQFNWLADNCGVNFQVAFLAPSESRRNWTVPVHRMKFEWTFLQDQPIASRLAAELRSGLRMLYTLFRTSPQAFICAGYDSVAGWAAFFWCKLFRRRFVLWCPSTSRDLRKPNVIKYWLKRLMFSAADGVASVGSASAAYALELGAKPEQLFFSWNAVDNDVFASEAGKVNPISEKRKLGYAPKVILYSGRLVSEKGVFVLIEAFAAVFSKASDVGLLLVGHGPAQAALEAACRAKNLDRVYFVGPQPYEHLPYYYAMADVLVLPTLSDPWGLVVNEAFAAGVPAIVSRMAGCCDDLIVEGITGFSVRPHDPYDLAQELLRLLCDDELRSAMRANCRHLISKFTQEACARGLLEAAMGTSNRSLDGMRRSLGPARKRSYGIFG